MCYKDSNSFKLKFSLKEKLFLPHTLSPLLYSPTPGGTTVCTTDPTSQNAALKFKSSTQAVLTTLAGSTHPLYLAFTALLASIAWLYLPLPLHFYLLMHFSTDPTCWYATRYYYPLYCPTLYVCLPCLRHPSTPDHKELLNKPTTWKGENNLIVHGQS